MFETGNLITTNNLNCFLIVDSNENKIVCKDLLNDDFCILDKSEHDYKIAEPKIILQNSLKEILDELNINNIDERHILEQMNIKLQKWIRN